MAVRYIAWSADCLVGGGGEADGVFRTWSTGAVSELKAERDSNRGTFASPLGSVPGKDMVTKGVSQSGWHQEKFAPDYLDNPASCWLCFVGR